MLTNDLSGDATDAEGDWEGRGWSDRRAGAGTGIGAGGSGCAGNKGGGEEGSYVEGRGDVGGLGCRGCRRGRSRCRVCSDGHSLCFGHHDDLLLVGKAVVHEEVIEEVTAVNIEGVSCINDVGNRHDYRVYLWKPCLESVDPDIVLDSLKLGGQKNLRLDLSQELRLGYLDELGKLRNLRQLVNNPYFPNIG